MSLEDQDVECLPDRLPARCLGRAAFAVERSFGWTTRRAFARAGFEGQTWRLARATRRRIATQLGTTTRDHAHPSKPTRCRGSVSARRSLADMTHLRRKPE